MVRTADGCDPFGFCVLPSVVPLAMISEAARRVMIDARKSGSNQLWGGRFADGPSAVMRDINASIPFDKRLWQQDIAGSKAHAAMLRDTGVIDAAAAAAILAGLDAVEAEYAAMLGRVDFVRKVVAKGVKLDGASDSANELAQRGFEACLEYIDWLETAIAVGRSQWQAAHPVKS